MTIAIKHQFVSLKGDGGDATQVQPSYWNASHAFTLASGQLVGRLSAGAGPAEEIPISAYMAGLLNTADATALAGVLGLFESGDFKYTLRGNASNGWVLMLGGAGTPNTIGNAASGASLRANADTSTLFSVIYNSLSDAVAPVSGGRTGNATNDFNSNKTIQIPNPVGRMPIGAGAATASTSARSNGVLGGAETHTLATTNLPPYTPAGSVVNGGISINHNANLSFSAGNPAGGSGGAYVGVAAASITASQAGSSFSGTAQGGASTPVNHMNTFIGLNVMVKL